jgi:hypothetical protein
MHAHTRTHMPLRAMYTRAPDLYLPPSHHQSVVAHRIYVVACSLRTIFSVLAVPSACLSADLSLNACMCVYVAYAYLNVMRFAQCDSAMLARSSCCRLIISFPAGFCFVNKQFLSRWFLYLLVACYIHKTLSDELRYATQKCNIGR